MHYNITLYSDANIDISYKMFEGSTLARIKINRAINSHALGH